MEKEKIVREMWRDLHGKNLDAVRSALARSGWTEGRTRTQVISGSFYGHLYMEKGGLELYFFFTDGGLNSVSTEN